MLKLRASKCAPLFNSGSPGLTPVQQATLDGLLAKIQLTDAQAKKRDELVAKRDTKPDLSQGAKTLIEEIIDEKVYQYKDQFWSKETDKGNAVEDEAIELYNRIFFTNYSKTVDGDKYAYLDTPLMHGHPDVVDADRLKVLDIKSSYTKKTFPKTEEKASKKVKESGYDWQVKAYLWMLRQMTGLDWRDGEVAYMLCNTPEELLGEWDEPSLHYMDDLDDNMRATVVKVTLTDDDIATIENWLKVANEYAEKYISILKNKNL